MTIDKLKKSSQLERDYQIKKEQEKSYAEAYSFVEKKATPKEGLAAFMQNYMNEFKISQDGLGKSDTLVYTRLKFIVEKDGSFSNIIAVGGNNETVSNETIRTLKTMPKWNPAEDKGEVVRSTFTLPIKVKINPDKIDVTN